MAQYLISKGVSVNEFENAGGWSPLYAAAFFGWPDVRTNERWLAWLARATTRPVHQPPTNPPQPTPHPQLVRLLMANGADPAIACKEGKRAIDVVCEAGYRGEHRATIEALLQNRPEPALPARAGRGRSSLKGAAESRLRRLDAAALAAVPTGAAAGGGGGASPSASAAALCEFGVLGL